MPKKSTRPVRSILKRNGGITSIETMLPISMTMSRTRTTFKRDSYRFSGCDFRSLEGAREPYRAG